MKIIRKLKKISPAGALAVVDKTCSSSPPLCAPAGSFSDATHTVWPILPKDEQTEGWFYGHCHELEMKSVTMYRDFVTHWFEHFSGEKGDRSATWWMRAKVGCWLQRCRHERLGIPLTDGFWRNYDAAMSGNVNRFDSFIRDILRFNQKEETEMASKKKAKKQSSKKSVTPMEISTPTPIGKKPLPVKKALPIKKATADGAHTRLKTIFNQSIASVQRWMGKSGFTGGETFAILQKLGFECNKDSCNSSVSNGKNGKGLIATLTKEQQSKLKSMLAAVRNG